MNNKLIQNQFLSRINAQPSADAIPSNARFAVSQCSNVEEFCARFGGAPEWVLDRLAARIYPAIATVPIRLFMPPTSTTPRRKQRKIKS